jgi:hypothetical protein
MRRSAWTILLLGLLPLAMAQDQVQSSTTDKQLALTVYNEDLALVEHVRAGNLPAGRHRIEFKGVSARIMPQTVSIAAAGLELVEQNFDYDLLTPLKLMEKAVGQTVRIVRTNPGTGAEVTESAEVLSTSGGVVLRVGNRIEVLRDDGIPARVIFDKVPDNLRASPTLSILANLARPLNSDIRLSYLSRGLSWTSDYVATFDEAAGEAAVQGWITLTNQSGTGFENARLQLVAGDVNSVDNERAWFNRIETRDRDRARSTRAGGTESGPRPGLADYYVYPIAEPTTVANNQKKQISFLSAARVKASKAYEATMDGFESSAEPAHAEVRMLIQNSRAAGLGEPMPSGIVRVYARDARGQPQFVGEDRIGHTNGGSELAVKIGEAFDVTVQSTAVSTEQLGNRTTEFSMRHVVRNARPVPITVTLRQVEYYGALEMVRESLKGRSLDARSLAWDVPVAANGEAELVVTIRRRQ